MTSRHLRFGAVLALASAMLVSLALVGTSAVGKPKPSAAQYQYKVTICHRTKAAKKPGVTISVSSRAVPAHLRHGDALGPCPTASSVQAKGNSSQAPGQNASSGQGQGQGQGQGKGQGKGQGQGQGQGKGK